MALIKHRNGRWVSAAEDYIRVSDDTPLPDAPVLVSLARLERDNSQLSAHSFPVGVILPPEAAPVSIAFNLSWLSLVAIQFPKFRDGRGYSWARQLRQRFRFQGELRATGQVLRDHWLFMSRCGFDALETAGHVSADEVLSALSEQSVFAQPAADGRGRIGRAHVPLMAAAE